MFWKERCLLLLEPPAEDDVDHEKDLRDRNWKALSIVTDAYGEWNKDNAAREILYDALASTERTPESKENVMRAVRQTARALAADRSTKLLPIAVAQSFFIGAVGIAIGRTSSAAKRSATSDTVFINIEAHSIAFSALYFWIIPAVFLSSVIGVSQTKAAIPRILRRFQVDLDRESAPGEVILPNHCLDNSQQRVVQGGVYSWQPFKNYSQHLQAMNASEDDVYGTNGSGNYEPLNPQVPGMSPLR